MVITAAQAVFHPLELHKPAALLLLCCCCFRDTEVETNVSILPALCERAFV